MRFGRKTVLDTDPPKKIKGREDLNYRYSKHSPERGRAGTSATFSPKGSYDVMKGKGYSYSIQENVPWEEFYNPRLEYDPNIFFEEGMRDSHYYGTIPDMSKYDAVTENLREYYRQYPGTNYVQITDEDGNRHTSFDGRSDVTGDFPSFFTEGRDELGTTYGTWSGLGMKGQQFVVTDPEVNTLVDLPAKRPSSPVPPNMELRNVMPEIYSRKLDQRNGQYIYETSEGTVKKKIGVEDARYIHQNRKAFNAMRKNR